LSRVRRNHAKRTQYSEPLITEEEIQELSAEDQELAARIEERRRRTRKSSARNKRRTVFLMILVFAALITMCSREIVRLKTENYALKRQHAQLEQERDRLTRELGHVGDKDYIKDQARKQLRLLDPGEKMFVFEDGKTQPEEEPAAEEESESEENSDESGNEGKESDE